MTIFHRIDDFVIDKMAQPCADWLSRRFGVSPYRLACNLFLACAAVDVLRTAIAYQDQKFGHAFLHGWGGAFASYQAHRAHAVDGRMQKDGTMNRERADEFIFRSSALIVFMIGLLLAVILLIAGEYSIHSVLSNANILAFQSGLYLVAVNRPPPRAKVAHDVTLRALPSAAM